MFAAVAVMVRLGVWQLDRMETRRAFNTHVVAMQASSLLVLDGSAISTDLTSMEYRHALATGAYDFEHQRALRNQYLGDPDGPAEYGYHLLTPLVMADGKSILVDRGWIPVHPPKGQRLSGPKRNRTTIATGYADRSDRKNAWFLVGAIGVAGRD